MSAITIFRGGAIGDFVLTLPAIDAVHRAFPAGLRLIGRPATLALGPAASILDGEDPRLIPLHRDGPLPPATRQLFAATQRVLAYAVDAQQHFGPQLRRAVAGPVLLWDPRPPADFRGHIIDHLLSPLQQWGLPVCDRTPHIELQPDDYGYVDALAARARSRHPPRQRLASQVLARGEFPRPRQRATKKGMAYRAPVRPSRTRTSDHRR